MADRMIPPLPTRTRNNAKALRGNQTDAESRLWFHLRAGRLNGLKFRRQHPIPPYVIDFYCHASALAVELDGSQHTAVVDAARTRFLEDKGIRILRFWDNDVLSNTNAVLEAILNAAECRALSPTPLPQGEVL